MTRFHFLISTMHLILGEIPVRVARDADASGADVVGAPAERAPSRIEAIRNPMKMKAHDPREVVAGGGENVRPAANPKSAMSLWTMTSTRSWRTH